MSQVSTDPAGSTTASSPRQHPDRDSAIAAMVVGSVFVVIVGAAVLTGHLYRRYPKTMAAMTIATLIAVALVLR